MKQLLQSAKDGTMLIADVPVPSPQPGMVVVQNQASLVSAGTERTLVDFAEKNLVQKARARPDLVRQVVDKVQRDGLLTTLEAVQTRLDKPMALGYSSAGVIVAVGEGVSDLQVGDRVACAGFGYAVHAEVIAVPKNLMTAIPDAVQFDEAAFTTLGAIAIQGIRQASPQLGDNVAVIGLGLLGQLTLQLLKANGCRVFGVDLDPKRVRLALELGIDEAVSRDEAVAASAQFTHNQGFDSVLITADARSNDPLELAGELARDKGVVVAVGAVGMQVPRKIYYNKELDLRLSRSYGPGRYDPQYEEQGIDYPYGYIRWTENRNMQAFLTLVGQEQVNLKPLITHHYDINQAKQAYDLISGKLEEPFLGVVLTYPELLNNSTTLQLPQGNHSATADGVISGKAIQVGMLGAGQFANSVLLPAMKQTEGLHLNTLCTSTGASGIHSGKRFGFTHASTDADQVLRNEAIDLVVIATPHNQHAQQIIQALHQGKHVFCEKPLCLSDDELQAVIKAYQGTQNQQLMVGFNRRFAALAQKMKSFIDPISEPLMVHYRINGGHIPADHWTQDMTIGGGRLLGEVCHFVDFITFLTGQCAQTVIAQSLPNKGRYVDDNLVLTLTYPDGSIGTITYVANGDKALGKERVEVFGGGRSAVLEDFRHLTLLNQGKRKTHRLYLRQDKGHKGEWAAFVQALQTGQQTPIPFDETVMTTLTTLRALDSLKAGLPMAITDEPLNQSPHSSDDDQL
ncbi:MAG: bi-domain-containing oxidoreductase [Chloroflexota bacterium]